MHTPELNEKGFLVAHCQLFKTKIMEIPTKYDPSKTEEKWYNYWLAKHFFRSVPDERQPYTVVIPPPNVTGVLHMGHVLNNTIQDVLVRKKRMEGRNTCWVPGTDHASIATEAKVVNYLKEKGIHKSNLSREAFLEYAWEWKERNGNIILEQLKKLGASCDWERTKFTMDDDMYQSVIEVFIDLYQKDKIYRGLRMVNWDPEAQTAISDEEVNYKEVDSKLYYVRYQVKGEEEGVTIATTRPETILGDTAVCIHPGDERFQHLKGKQVFVPLINREIPVIEDEYVDPEFGTGLLKITPAHDPNDHEIGKRHNLEVIDILNEDATLSPDAELFIGEDRFKARDLINKELQAQGHMIKVEDYVNKIGFSERTDAVIEPRLSMQWFVRMKELAAPALENVMNNNIRFYPENIKNTYKQWMENIKDWCISRQLWWGQRIPVYYAPDGTYVVARSYQEALEAFHQKGAEYTHLTVNDLKQDEDVVDTWFSSWLWPITVFNGILDPDNADYHYYYPTDDLVTAPEILFFWVARMIMAGYEYRGEKPFSNVYFTGIVRDIYRRKMSKSLGNSPDPLDLIQKYSADGTRFGILLSSPAGGDLLFDERLTEQGRNFCNKIWNAFRLVMNWEVDESLQQPQSASVGIHWFEAKLNDLIVRLEEDFSRYRLSEALMKNYRFFWDDFSAWYLEIIKPGFQEAIDQQTYQKTLAFFETILKLLHPFMPFISEEVWQLIQERKDGESIMISDYPVAEHGDQDVLQRFEEVQSIITAIRNVRKENDIAYKDSLQVYVKKEANQYNTTYDDILMKLANVDHIDLTADKLQNAASFMVGGTEYYVPLGDKINVQEEIQKVDEELEYKKGFLHSVMKKLNNSKFVDNAPADVVDKERKKKEDAEQEIRALEDRKASLKEMQ